MQKLIIQLFIILVISLLLLVTSLYIVFKVKTILAIAIGILLTVLAIYMIVRTVLDLIKIVFRVLS